MRVVGLMSWFDEPATWLQSALSSYAQIGIDHIIAVDGAYELFPDARARSDEEQYRAIHEVATVTGVGLTVYTPARVWPGEIEKRNHMFALAEAETTEADWYCVIDADELISENWCSLKRELAQTDKDVAELVMWHRDPPEDGTRDPSIVELPLRKFYRAQRGLRACGNHYTYKVGDRVLWGNAEINNLEPAQRLNIRMEHRTELRGVVRKMKAQTYYRKRREAGTEYNHCAWCMNEVAVSLPHAFEWDRVRTNYLRWSAVDVCTEHVPRVWEENLQRWSEIAGGVPTDQIKQDFDQALMRAGIDPGPITG